MGLMINGGEATSLPMKTLVKPSTGASIQLTAKATAWKTGAYSAGIATQVITSNFAICGINVEDVSTIGIFCITLSEGTAGATVLCQARFSAQATMVNGMYIPVETKVVSPNKAIKGKIESNIASAVTLDLSVSYKV